MISYKVLKQGINKKAIMPVKIYFRKKKYNLNNLSIISCNCIGGIICHDYGLEFKSPTINLFFYAEDYVKFIENLNYYIEENLVFKETHKQGYPICKLDDLTIHFVHYKNFNECFEKWKKRKRRINFENILCVFTDQNGCTDELVKRFAKIPYKKIMFSSKRYPEYDFVRYIQQDQRNITQNRSPIDDIMILNGLTGKRNYEKYFNLAKYMGL